MAGELNKNSTGNDYIRLVYGWERANAVKPPLKKQVLGKNLVAYTPDVPNRDFETDRAVPANLKLKL